jgi:hypothetical protein
MRYIKVFLNFFIYGLGIIILLIFLPQKFPVIRDYVLLILIAGIVLFMVLMSIDFILGYIFGLQNTIFSRIINKIINIIP